MKIKLEYDQGVVTLRVGGEAVVLDPSTLESLADWCRDANEEELVSGEWLAVESDGGAGDNVVTCSDDSEPDDDEDEDDDDAGVDPDNVEAMSGKSK